LDPIVSPCRKGLKIPKENQHGLFSPRNHPLKNVIEIGIVVIATVVSAQ